MEEHKSPAQRVIKQLTNKYRLVVMNDETFEEVSSFRLSRVNIYILLSTIIVIIVTFITSAIVFTPLKEYIPGYASTSNKRELINLRMKTDSIDQAVIAQDLFVKNLQSIINNGEPIEKIDTPVIDAGTVHQFDSIDLKKISPMESKLRDNVENESSFMLNLDLAKDQIGKKFSSIAEFHFFQPVKGYVTAGFAPKEEHYGVDIVAPENETIKATLDGVVVIANWTTETGYVIAIQHSNNLISLYKHNSVLLKKEGAYVKAGDVIAIIGNSGEQTSGPHLHFELWYKGLPLNPQDYIVFN